MKKIILGILITLSFGILSAQTDVTITGSFGANDKSYDGTKAAVLIDDLLTLDGVTSGDDVSLDNVVLEFESSEIGDGIEVSIISASLVGDDAASYNLDLTGAPTATANISKAPLILAGVFTADDKIYDGTKDADITVTTAITIDSGIVGSEDVSVDLVIGEFGSPNVGTNLQVNLYNSTLTGTDAANYQIKNTPTADADITAKTVTIDGTFTASNREYDCTVDATIDASGLSLDGGITGDLVTLTAVGEFTDASVGTGKTVNLNGSTLAGADKDNYTLSFTGADEAEADITKRTITISGGTFTVNDKDYDGSNIFPITTNSLTFSGIVCSEDVDIDYVATSADEEVEADKTISLTSSTLTGTDKDHYTLSFTGAPTIQADINLKTLTIINSFTADDKVYDGNKTASFDENHMTLIGVVGAEDVSLSNLSIEFVQSAIGTNLVVDLMTADLAGDDIANYELSTANWPTANADITAKELTIDGGFTAENKIYDGNTSASIIGGHTLALDGIVGSEDVDIVYSATFDDKNIGTGIVVRLTNSTLTGTAKDNYTLNTSSPTTSANITAKELTINGIFTANSKTYDGNVSATINTNSLGIETIVGTEDVTLSSSVSLEFLQSAIGTGLTVDIVSAELSGVDKGNYTLSLTGAPTTTADITGKTLTISGTFTASDKTYDALTSATIDGSLLVLDGVEIGDVVNLNAVGNFVDKNVGIGKEVDLLSSTIVGSESSNYVLSFTGVPTTNATISQKEISIGGTFTANNRIYDGSTDATIDNNSLALSGIESGDFVTLNEVATFDTKEVGVGKTVDLESSYLTNTDAANYEITSSTTTNANITQKELTIGGTFSVEDKIYDMTTDAAIEAGSTLALNGVVAPDDVDIVIVANFDNADIGTGKTVDLSASSLSGDDKDNYSLNTTSPTASADITAKTLTISGTFTVENKIYDATTSVTINSNTLGLTGVLGGQDVSLSSLNIAFGSAAVGNGKFVSIISAGLSGDDKDNYELSLTGAPTTSANITQKELTISGSYTANDKIYNALTNASFDADNLTLVGVVSGDDVDFDNVVIVFDDILVGTDIPVSISSASITGSEALNYSISLTGAPTSLADITVRELTIGGSFLVDDKTYDGTASATMNTDNLTLVNIAGSDVISLSNVSIEFVQSAIGNNINVGVVSAELSGVKKDNYFLSIIGAPTNTADITAKILTIAGTFTVNNKIYDGNSTASFLTNTLSLVGVESGDVVNLNDVASFNNKNVGTGKAVSLNNSTITGDDIGNYTLSFVGAFTTTAAITQKPISITGTFGVDNRAYNGNTSALISSNSLALTGTIITDDVLLEPQANFDTKDVGDGKTVDLESSVLTGLDAGNYEITSSSTTTANITAKELTISGTFTAENKTYDGSTSATIIGGHTLVLVGVVAAEDVDIVPVANFSTSIVGNGKLVSLTNSSLTGDDDSNYTLNTSSPTTIASITKKDLTISGSYTVFDKTYDATTDATFDSNTLALSGIETGDIVTLNAVATFDTKNVGTGKSIDLTNSTIGGDDVDNYTLSFTGVSDVFADISKKDITIGGSFTAFPKVFDNLTDATINTNLLSLSGVEASDVSNVILNPVLNFEDEDIGTNKVVDLLSSTISGTEASNYNLTFTLAPTTLANITAQELTIGGSFSAENKIYDRTSTATIDANNLTLIGVIGGHTVSLSDIVLDFDQITVGSNIDVNITSASLDGADAGNYSLSLTGAPDIQANIIAKDITISGSFDGTNKTYDGNTTASISSSNLSLVGVINPDVVLLTEVANFDTKNIGTDKTVSLSNSVLTGVDAFNYNLSFDACPTSEADILAKELTITGSFIAANKTYDGNTTASFSSNSLTLSGVVVTETVALNTPAINFLTVNVGNSITVNITAADLSGIDHGNYTVTTSGSPQSSANITAKELTLSGGFNAEDKIYDGNKDASIVAGHTLGLIGVVLSDDVSLNPIAQFSDKDVADGKTVSLLTSGLTGTKAGNYSLDATTPTTTADITHKELTIAGTFTAADKTYDGNTNATIVLNNLSLTGVVNTEDVTLNPVLNFENATVGTNKIVNILSSTLSGTAKNNYTLNATTANTTLASITSCLLTISGDFTVADKTYDGNITATIDAGHTLTLENISGSDDVSLTPIANFTNKNVGNGKSVNLASSTLAGTHALNYSIDFTGAPTTNANITAKAITIGGDFLADDKVYDKTSPTNINVNNLTLIGVINPDVVTLTANADFISVDVGSGINVTLNNNSIIEGANCSNYTLSFVDAPTASASITPKSITITGSFTADNKTYDGNTDATIATSTLVLSGLETGDVVALDAVAKFDTPSIGNNKPVDISNSSISGSSSGNYELDIPELLIAYANISAQEITLSGSFEVNDKIYDGNTDAIVSVDNVVLNGIVGTEDVSLDLIPLFNNRLVGTDKPVSLLTSELIGSAAGNYSLSFASAPSTTADITQKELIITGTFTAENKDYDGNTSATIDENNLVLSGLISGDIVSVIGLIVKFDQSTVGDDIAVTITEASIVGDDEDNYSLSIVGAPDTEADIYSKTLVIEADNKSKIYGEADPVNTVSYVGFIIGEDENDLSGTLSFNRQAGESLGSYTITPSGLSSTNYNIQFLDGILIIESKELTISGDFTVFDKNYDGITTATMNQNNLTLQTIVGADDVMLLNSSIVLNFVDANIGDGKIVNITSASLTGSDAMNYTLSLIGASHSTASITDVATASVTVSSLGDFINNGTFDSRTRKVSFNSSNQQSIKTNAWPFYDIEFNNLSGLSDAIKLQDDLVITNIANFTSGIIDADGNTVVFLDGASTNIGGSNAFINGEVSKTGSTAFDFPVGDVRERDLGSGNTVYKIWAPFTAIPSGNTEIRVDYMFENEGLHDWWYHAWTHEFPLTHTSDREYWRVNSSSDLAVTLYWKDNDPCTIHDICEEGTETFNSEDLTIAYWDGIWKDAGGTATTGYENGSITSDMDIPFVAKGEIQITFGAKDREMPLPVELLDFTANCIKTSANIFWQTASETNNDYFILEKSNGVDEFYEIARLQGAGNSNIILDYNFIDDELFAGDNYYRLKQVDFDGKITVYDIISLNCDGYVKSQPVMYAFPNPFKDEVNVVIENIDKGEFTLEILDDLGRVVYLEKCTANGSDYRTSLKLNDLRPAVYNLRSKSNDNVLNVRVVKQ